MAFTTWSDGDVVTAAKLNNDNTYAVSTDTARTITVTHTWSAAQTMDGGWTAAAACTITVASATAFAVGRQGATDPALLVHSSTASQATGIQITGKAAASGAAIAVISSGTNENLTVDAKGSGTVTIGGTSTGAITLTRATTISAAATITGALLAGAAAKSSAQNSNQHDFELNSGSGTVFVMGVIATGAAPFGIDIEYTGADPNGTGNSFWKCYGTTTLRAEMRSNGGLANFSGNNVNLSDARVKNLGGMLDGDAITDAIRKLDFLEYYYKSDNAKAPHLGTTAQRAHAAFASSGYADSIVDMQGWALRDGRRLGAVKETNLLYALGAALKRTIERLDALADSR